MFLGRRERNIKAGWRHGITGVENADSDNCSVYFQQQYKDKCAQQSEKDILNKTRLDSKYRLFLI